MKKLWFIGFIFLSFQLIGCESTVYEPDSIIMNEVYQEESKGSGLFEVIAIVAIIFALANLGRRK
jgi:hypothetical protein